MISESLKGRRDSRVETEIAKMLRTFDASVAAEMIIRFVAQDRAFRDYQRHQIGSSLANRVLRKRAACVYILAEGRRLADASTVYFWIRAMNDRLGLRYIIGECFRNLDSSPETVGFEIYWLRQRFWRRINDIGMVGTFSRLMDAYSGKVGRRFDG